MTSAERNELEDKYRSELSGYGKVDQYLDFLSTKANGVRADATIDAAKKGSHFSALTEVVAESIKSKASSEFDSLPTTSSAQGRIDDANEMALQWIDAVESTSGLSDTNLDKLRTSIIEGLTAWVKDQREKEKKERNNSVDLVKRSYQAFKKIKSGGTIKGITEEADFFIKIKSKLQAEGWTYPSGLKEYFAAIYVAEQAGETASSQTDLGNFRQLVELARSQAATVGGTIFTPARVLLVPLEKKLDELEHQLYGKITDADLDGLEADKKNELKKLLVFFAKIESDLKLVWSKEISDPKRVIIINELRGKKDECLRKKDEVDSILAREILGEIEDTINGYIASVIRELDGVLGIALELPLNESNEGSPFSVKTYNLVLEWAHLETVEDGTDFIENVWLEMQGFWDERETMSTWDEDYFARVAVLMRRADRTKKSLIATSAGSMSLETEAKYQYLDVIINRAQWLLEERGRIEAAKAGRMGRDIILPEIRLERPSVPVQATEQAWNNSYKDFLGKLDDEEKRLFIQNEILVNLERDEAEFAERRKFSTAEQGGLKYKGLLLWLRIEIDALESKSKVVRLSDKELARLELYSYYKEYLDNRLALADVMGPFAVSAMMTANFDEAFNKEFPDFAIWTIQYFLGTKYKDSDSEKLRHLDYKIVRQLIREFQVIFNEQYDFIGKPPKTDPAFFSFGSGKWMNGEGNPHVSFLDSVFKKLGLDSKLTEDERRRLGRIALSCYSMTGERASHFMSYYAIGMSPPKFNSRELEIMMQMYPQAKELNLGTKEVIAIPSVVLGQNISYVWLLRMAARIGLYVDMNTRPAIQGSSYVDGHLWGEGSLPEVTDPSSFDKAVLSLVTEDQAKKILDRIKDDNEYIDDAKYVRFRNLLRSISLSLVLRDYINFYDGERPFEFVNQFGEFAQDGLLLCPIMASPGIMIFGPTEFDNKGEQPVGKGSYYASLGTNYHDLYVDELKAVGNFYSHVYSPPPKLEGGIDAMGADIKLLENDLFKTLNFTSAMKSQATLLHWREIHRLIIYRMHVLFAEFAKHYGDPLQKPHVSLGQMASSSFGIGKVAEQESLVQAFSRKIRDSGQTMSGSGEETWWSIAQMRSGSGTGKVLYRDINGSEVSFKLALASLLVESKLRVSISPNNPLRKLDRGMYRGGPEQRIQLWKKWTAIRHLMRVYNINDYGIGDNLLPVGGKESRDQQDKEMKGSNK